MRAFAASCRTGETASTADVDQICATMPLVLGAMFFRTAIDEDISLPGAHA